MNIKIPSALQAKKCQISQFLKPLNNHNLRTIHTGETGDEIKESVAFLLSMVLRGIPVTGLIGDLVLIPLIFLIHPPFGTK